MDAYLSKCEWQRLQSEANKPRRTSAGQVDEYFDENLMSSPHSSLIKVGSTYLAPAETGQSFIPDAVEDDDVFAKPAPPMTESVKPGKPLSMWEDISSSICKLDPENIDVFGENSGQLVKPEIDPMLSVYNNTNSNFSSSSNLLVPKVEKSATESTCQTVETPVSVQSGILDNTTLHMKVLGPHFHRSITTVHQEPNLSFKRPTLVVPRTASVFLQPNVPRVSPEGLLPPNSDLRRTPPPPYPTSPIVGNNNEIISSNTKYNRRNNPELEKRRIHHCDHPGELQDTFVIQGSIVRARVSLFFCQLKIPN